MKKCLYCQCELPPESVIDFCKECGEKVWGPKMLNAIIENMEKARANDDLCRTNNFSEVSDFNNFKGQKL